MFILKFEIFKIFVNYNGKYYIKCLLQNNEFKSKVVNGPCPEFSCYEKFNFDDLNNELQIELWKEMIFRNQKLSNLRLKIIDLPLNAKTRFVITMYDEFQNNLDIKLDISLHFSLDNNIVDCKELENVLRKCLPVLKKELKLLKDQSFKLKDDIIASRMNYSTNVSTNNQFFIENNFDMSTFKKSIDFINNNEKSVLLSTRNLARSRKMSSQGDILKTLNSPTNILIDKYELCTGNMKMISTPHKHHNFDFLLASTSDNEQCYENILKSIIKPEEITVAHKFRKFSAQKPCFCSECASLLWGLSNQGLKCSNCSLKCHNRCKDLVCDDCPGFKLMKSSKSSKSRLNSSRRDAIAIKNESLSCIEVNMSKSNDTGSFLRRILNESVNKNMNIINTVNSLFEIDMRKFSFDNILSQLSNDIFTTTSTIIITVICAKNLTGKDSTGKSDPYVTIQVGREKKRTKTIIQNLNPVWNESFTFERCLFNENIKIRVWDEDNDLKSKIKQTLTKEGDEFLGQIIFKNDNLYGERDDIYQLTTRTIKSDISGSIRIRTSIIVNENKSLSYHQQFIILYLKIFLVEIKTIFVTIYKWSDSILSLDDIENTIDENPNEIFFFDDIYKILIEKYCKSYGISNCFQIIIIMHSFQKYLSQHGVYKYMTYLTNKLFDKLEDSFNSSILINPYIHEKLCSVINDIIDCSKEDISNYRFKFLYSDDDKISDLKYALKLFKKCYLFQSKFLQIKSNCTINELIRKAIINNSIQTYIWLLKKCSKQLNIQEYFEFDDENNLLNTNKLSYWMIVIDCLYSLMEQNSKCYKPIFEEEFSIDVSHVEFDNIWIKLSNQLHLLITNDVSIIEMEADLIVNFYFKLKNLFSKYSNSSTMNSFDSSLIKDMFSIAFKVWIEFNEESLIDVTHNAFEKDKINNFQTISEDHKFSNSVLDIFTCLEQSVEIVNKLNKETKGNLWDLYSKTIVQIIIIYMESINEFSENIQISIYIQDFDSIYYRLMNNIYQTRVNLQSIVCKIFTNDIMDETANHFKNIDGMIDQILNFNLNKIIQKISPHTLLEIEHIFSNIIKMDFENIEPVDNIMKNIFILLDEIITNFSEHLIESITERIVKILYAMLIEQINLQIFSTDANKINQKKMLESNTSNCVILNKCVVALKSYFTSFFEHFNFDKTLLDESSDKKLLSSLNYWLQSTESLINLFKIKTSKKFDKMNTPMYQISLSIGLKNDEFYCEIEHIPAFTNKQSCIIEFSLYDSIDYLIIFTKKLTFGAIHSLPISFQNYSSKFKDLMNYELMCLVKHNRTFTKDKILYIGSIDINIPRKSILNVLLHPLKINLYDKINYSKSCYSILKVLAMRNEDKIAQRFVSNKNIGTQI